MKSSPRRFEVRERVRWSDIDSAGIIYFGAYVRFVEIAESELYRELGFTYADFDRLGMWLPKVHLEFDFFSPAVLDDELLLATAIGEIGASSVRMHVDVRNAKEANLLAEATLVSACIDRERQSLALPALLASALRASAGDPDGRTSAISRA